MDASSVHYFVFGGGGTRGIAYAGALLEWLTYTKYNLQLNLKGCAGTSIGGLYAAALCCGLPPDQIMSIAKNTNLIDIVNIDITNLWSFWGMESGNSIVSWLTKIIGDVSFRKLYENTGRRLELVVTNLNSGQAEYLSHETVPEMQVAQGVAISMALPPVFPPVKLKNHLFIDGGVIDNYPIHRFPAEEVLGFRVKWGHVPNLDSFEHYFSRVMYCATVSGVVAKYNNLEDGYKERSITIDTGDVPTINWRLSPTTVAQCIAQGRRAVRQFILDRDVRATKRGDVSSIATQTD
jgi:predicted acylesterase/phospholipase RssA